MADGPVEQAGGPAGSGPQTPRILRAGEFLDTATGKIHRPGYDKTKPAARRSHKRKSTPTGGNRPAARDGFDGADPNGAAESSRAKAQLPPQAPLKDEERPQITKTSAAALVAHAFSLLAMILGPHWRVSAPESIELGNAIVETQNVLPTQVVGVAIKAAAPLHLFAAFVVVVAPRYAQTLIMQAQAKSARSGSQQAQQTDRTMRQDFGGVRYDVPPPPNGTVRTPADEMGMGAPVSGLVVDPATGRVVMSGPAL